MMDNAKRQALTAEFMARLDATPPGTPNGDKLRVSYHKVVSMLLSGATLEDIKNTPLSLQRSDADLLLS